MIPALATIVAVYVIFRCCEITLGRLEGGLVKVVSAKTALIIKLGAFLIVGVLGLAVILLSLDQLNAIMKAATDTASMF
jgi:hypothetical protein